MHFDIFSEDISGLVALESIVPRILVKSLYTAEFKSYKGIGHLPKDLYKKKDPSVHTFLHNLPSLLKGLGRSYAGYGSSCAVCAIFVCDLDERCLKTFRQTLLEVLEVCDPKPTAAFCIAVEEMEAWLLGDIDAVKKAFPKAKLQILRKYKNDSICGTWELLADAIESGGATQLKRAGYPDIGIAKCSWAEKIAPLIDVENNASPSFAYFRDTLRKLAGKK